MTEPASGFEAVPDIIRKWALSCNLVGGANGPKVKEGLQAVSILPGASGFRTAENLIFFLDDLPRTLLLRKEPMVLSLSHDAAVRLFKGEPPGKGDSLHLF